MNRTQLTTLLLCFATTATLTGCSKFLAKDADGSSVSRMIGPEGGELTLPDGLWLKIEPDALIEDTEITITKLDPQDDLVAGSHRYRFEPEGLVFGVPATLDIPYPDEGYALEDVRMYVENDRSVSAVQVIGGGDIALSGGGSSKYAQGRINHFSTYSCGVPATPTSTCFQPVPANDDGICEAPGAQGPFTWGITEWGGVGYREAVDDCPRPRTTVSFTVNAPEVWILTEWSVTGNNVASVDEGTRDLTDVPRAFVPEPPNFDWRAAGAALPAPFTDPFFSWWSFEVWPANQYLPMNYTFTLKVVQPSTGMERTLTDGYETNSFDTECMACPISPLVRGEDDRFRKAACEYEDEEDDTTDDGVADDGDSDDGGTDDGVNDGGGTTSGDVCDDPIGLTEGYWSSNYLPFGCVNGSQDIRFECDGTLLYYERCYLPSAQNDACGGCSEEVSYVGTWDLTSDTTIAVTTGNGSEEWTLEDNPTVGDLIRWPDNDTFRRAEAADPWYPDGCCDGQALPRGREPVGCNAPAGW